jgi:hypothetical protein
MNRQDVQAVPGVAPRVHLSLTVLLGLIVLGFLGLTVAGQIHFGKAPQPTATDKDRPGSQTPSQERADGVYRVLPLESAGKALTEAARMYDPEKGTFFGDRMREIAVFKYRGGYLEAWLEAETVPGQRMTLGPVPAPGSLKPVLASDVPLAEGKEGFIILAAVENPLPVEVALGPYAPQLGGLFAGGPGGPLPVLPYLGFDCWHPTEYRLFVSAEPPAHTRGAAFRQFSSGGFPLRFPFGPGRPFPSVPKITDSTDTKPGEELVLAAWSWGDNTLALKARFFKEEDLKKAAEEERTPAPAK